MVKRKFKPTVKEREVVFSEKYQCLIAKDTAIFDKEQNSYISPNIEKEIGEKFKK